MKTDLEVDISKRIVSALIDGGSLDSAFWASSNLMLSLKRQDWLHKANFWAGRVERLVAHSAPSDPIRGEMLKVWADLKEYVEEQDKEDAH